MTTLEQLSQWLVLASDFKQATNFCPIFKQAENQRQFPSGGGLLNEVMNQVTHTFCG
jgi:hypothetical protein